MESTEDSSKNSALGFPVFTIPGWGEITLNQLDSPFEDDNDTIDPMFTWILCRETYTLLKDLRNHERLRHKDNTRNKRQRQSLSSQAIHFDLQSDNGDARKSRRVSSSAGPSYPQLVDDDTRWKPKDPLKTFKDAEKFSSDTNLKDLNFTMTENNLNVVYQQYFSKMEADQIFKELEKEIEYFPSEMATIVTYNKRYPIPRKVSAYGDTSLTYTYSRNTLPTKPFIPILRKILKEANKFLKEGSFNYVLINRYKDGNDKIGSHKDNEKDMDPNSPIVTFSFGADRTMIFKRPNFESVEISLKNGSVLIMNTPTNKFWYHQIPREKKIKDVRISLTFRKNVSSTCKKQL